MSLKKKIFLVAGVLGTIVVLDIFSGMLFFKNEGDPINNNELKKLFAFSILTLFALYNYFKMKGGGSTDNSA